MALTLVRGLGQLSALAPCLAPIFIFSDLLKIETTLPEIETALSEIKRQQVGHDFKQGDLDFQQVGKMLVQICDIKYHIYNIYIITSPRYENPSQVNRWRHNCIWVDICL